jgi:hypothetical protein
MSATSTPSATYHRPTTRGELRDALNKNISCEVVADNVGITNSFLAVLECTAFKVRLSENAGWAVYDPDPAKQA